MKSKEAKVLHDNSSHFAISSLPFCCTLASSQWKLDDDDDDNDELERDSR